MTIKNFLSKRINFIFLTVILLIICNPFAIVTAGKRGVLLEFGRVKNQILDEGIHFIIPGVNTVKYLSVRVQKQDIFAEASSKDLQEIFTDVWLNWHIIPEETNLIYQQIGKELEIIDRIINPAIEEVLKAVMANYTAEEIITKRGEVKAQVDEVLTNRLRTYHIAVDDICLVHIHFSQKFSDAVEAKQIAEQEAKRAGFMVLKASKEAEAKINVARGEAEAQKLLRETITPELLQKQAIEKWDGKLPTILGDRIIDLLNLPQ